jgi:hypothetical protein
MWFGGKMKVTDYHTFVNKNTPKDKRNSLHVGDVWLNQAKCLECGDVIRSKNLHHFVTCTCGNLSVDGGSWYLKRVSLTDNWEDQSEMFSDVKKDVV